MNAMELDALRKQALAEIETALSANELESIRLKYLGRKQGIVTAMLKELAGMTEEEKRQKGPLVQKLRSDLESAISFREKETVSGEFSGDITLPPQKVSAGHLNLITQTEDESGDDVFGVLAFGGWRATDKTFTFTLLKK